MAKVPTLASRIALLGSALPIATASASWRSEKTSSTARGYGYKWQQAREGFLRAHPLCVYCERDGQATAATVVDHKVPHRGDMKVFWDRTNWQGLCKPHHDGEKQREESAEFGR